MKRILVLGNGFDLHHDMKTRYSDYINFMKDLDGEKINYMDLGIESNIVKKQSSFFDNSFVKYFILYSEHVNGWIDFEILLMKCIYDLDYIINSFNYPNQVNIYSNSGECSCRLNFLKSSFSNIFTKFNNSSILKDDYVSRIEGINRKKIYTVIEKEFDDFCESLWMYLKYFEPYRRENTCEIIYKQIKEIGAQGAITFNYTDTYKNYGIQSNEVIHIHGSLKDQNIILGFHDIDKDDFTQLYFKKYMQRLIHKTQLLDMSRYETDIFDRHGYRTGESDKAEVHAFGHSLDETDIDILKEILLTATKSVIYYQNEEDRKEKMMNIVKLLDKENAINKIENGIITFEKIILEQIQPK